MLLKEIGIANDDREKGASLDVKSCRSVQSNDLDKTLRSRLFKHDEHDLLSRVSAVPAYAVGKLDGDRSFEPQRAVVVEPPRILELGSVDRVALRCYHWSVLSAGSARIADRLS